MELLLKGESKEIADFVLAIQNQQVGEMDISKQIKIQSDLLDTQIERVQEICKL